MDNVVHLVIQPAGEDKIECHAVEPEPQSEDYISCLKCFNEHPPNVECCAGDCKDAFECSWCSDLMIYEDLDMFEECLEDSKKVIEIAERKLSKAQRLYREGKLTWDMVWELDFRADLHEAAFDFNHHYNDWRCWEDTHRAIRWAKEAARQREESQEGENL